MSRSSTEEWERRKLYLVRSLFSEVPLLSPIPEIQESSEPTLAPGVVISRPYSPLPDLIIEKEPNRHDEPEEYYQALEKRVKKFYWKLFINNEKSSDSLGLGNHDECFIQARGSCIEPVVIVEEINQFKSSYNDDEDSNNNLQPVDQDFFDAKIMEHTDVPCEETYTENKEYDERSIEICNKSIDHLNDNSNNITSSESCNHELITTQAQVHLTGSKKTDNQNHCIITDVMQASSSEKYEFDKSIIPSALTDTETSGAQSEYGNLEEEFEDPSFNHTFEHSRLSNGEDLMLKSRCFTCITDASSTPMAPEMMRRRKTSGDSVESSYGLDIGRYFSENFTTDKTLQTGIASLREIEEIEELTPEMSIILEPNFTSKLARNKVEYNPQDKDRKRGFLSERTHLSRAPPKHRKFEDLAIQTSFSTSNDENNWQELQKHFFVGNPQIFKLCSCNSHICWESLI